MYLDVSFYYAVAFNNKLFVQETHLVYATMKMDIRMVKLKTDWSIKHTVVVWIACSIGQVQRRLIRMREQGILFALERMH